MANIRKARALEIAVIATIALAACIQMPVPPVPTPFLPSAFPTPALPQATETVVSPPQPTETVVSPPQPTVTVVSSLQPTEMVVLSPQPTTTQTPVPSPTSPHATLEIPVTGDPVLVGAGDISRCSNQGDKKTAALLAQIDGTIFTAGDSENDEGALDQYARCFDPDWGAMKARIHPALGNHDYLTPKASGFFEYFQAEIDGSETGYYSYDLGAWHIVVLNSNCAKVGGCEPGSPQETWLRADLAAHRVKCTLAYWHHPRFSSGKHGNDEDVQPFWDALYVFGAEVVVNGHNHDYERFAPQDPNGGADRDRGIREFVAGTGGANHDPFPEPALPNTEVRDDATFGVLKFTLHPASYDWEFIPVQGKAFTDSGTSPCH